MNVKVEIKINNIKNVLGFDTPRLLRKEKANRIKTPSQKALIILK